MTTSTPSEAEIEALEETLGALKGYRGEGWINISQNERRLFARLLSAHIEALRPIPESREALPSEAASVTRKAINALTTEITSVQPNISIGDEDSIYLTDWQEGYKRGLQHALALITGGTRDD